MGRLRIGERTLPEVVDELAIYDPTKVWACLVRIPNLVNVYRDVTVKELASAVNLTAWWIEETIGRSGSFETIAYQGNSDVRYATIWLAAIKCGYKLHISSPIDSSKLD